MLATLFIITFIFNTITMFAVIVHRIYATKHIIYLNSIITLNFITLYPLLIIFRSKTNGAVTPEFISNIIAVTQYSIPLCTLMTVYYFYHALVKNHEQDN